MMPLISIITITYNAADHLPATLQSLKDQTFTDFEHIIVDGASTDNTLAIARTLGLEQARILSEPDRGLYFAMNKGLGLARGKYILFLNAGDALHTPQTLQQYAEAALQQDADIIYADTVIVNDRREILRNRHLSAPETLDFKSFAHGMLICHQAFMAKRQIAPQYDTAYRFSADYDWTIRCIKATTPQKCVNLHTIAIEYLEMGTTDKNKKASLAERFKIMCRHYGTMRTVMNHISFIPRAINRRINRHP